MTQLLPKDIHKARDWKLFRWKQLSEAWASQLGDLQQHKSGDVQYIYMYFFFYTYVQ